MVIIPSQPGSTAPTTLPAGYVSNVQLQSQLLARGIAASQRPRGLSPWKRAAVALVSAVGGSSVSWLSTFAQYQFRQMDEEQARRSAELAAAEALQQRRYEEGNVSLIDSGGNGTSWGGLLSSLAGQYFAYRSGQAATPGGGGIIQTMGALPPVLRAGAGAAIGAVGGVAVRSASSAMRAAVTWCRRNPAWCANIGGTAAVAAMVSSGQLPAPRRRRGRGISSRDLRSYRRVHNLLAGFCAPKARIRKRTC